MHKWLGLIGLVFVGTIIGCPSKNTPSQPQAITTETNTATNTPTQSKTETATGTPTITATPTKTLSLTSTSTPTNTLTPTISSTSTNTPTITDTQTNTPTPTITNTPTITFTPTAVVTPILSWGTYGTNNGDIINPISIAFNSAGTTVYVADSGNSAIESFTSNGVFTGNEVFFGTDQPSGVAVDTSSNVYVTAIHNDISIYSSDFSTQLADWNVSGQFQNPTGIVVNSSATTVYISDSGNNCIQAFNPNGTPITQWGSLGNGNGQFSAPGGLAIDSSGNVYVVDAGNKRIQKFTSTGTYITQWGGSGNGNGSFSEPENICVNSSGSVYVTDFNNNLVQKFSSSGTFLTQWSVTYPMGVAVGYLGNIYVSLWGATSGGMIQVFEP